MKKSSKIAYFLKGFICALLVVSLTTGVLAATGTVKFSSVNVALNGQQVGAKGEYYTLANGESAPYSISYVDEQGGGTTYLPVRKVCELLGIEIQWDGSTGTANIVTNSSEAAVPEQEKPDPKSYWTHLDYVKIGDKIYTTDGVIILKDIPYNNESFCAIRLDEMDTILALAYKDYKIREEQNPNLSGKIIPNPLNYTREVIDGITYKTLEYSQYTTTYYSSYESATKVINYMSFETPNTKLLFSDNVPEEIGSVYYVEGIRCFKYGTGLTLQFVSIDDLCQALGVNFDYDFETIDGKLVLVVK